MIKNKIKDALAITFSAILIAIVVIAVLYPIKAYFGWYAVALFVTSFCLYCKCENNKWESRHLKYRIKQLEKLVEIKGGGE